MRRIVFLLALTLSALCRMDSTAIAETDAMSLLSKMIEARGGSDRLSELRTSISKGKIIMVSQAGASGEVTVTRMPPDKVLIEMTFGSTLIKQGFDRDMAWVNNPLAGGFQELPAAEAQSMKRNAIGDDALINPEKYGIRYSYEGRAADRDKEYHVLKQVSEDGIVVSVYVDTESYLIHKTVVAGGSSQQIVEEAYYSDYRTTDGITQAYEVSVFLQGQETVKYIFDQVNYNSQVDEAVFRMGLDRFSRGQLMADARQLAAIIEDTHPDPYEHLGGRIAFHRHLQHMLHDIPHDGMTGEEFMNLVRPFVARVGDAHTEVYSHRTVNMLSPGGIPFRFGIVEQSLVVTGVPNEEYLRFLGAVLVSVEGVTIEELGTRLAHIKPIDNQYLSLWHFATNYLWYGAYLQEVLPEWEDTDRLRATFLLPSGEVTEVVFDFPVYIFSLLGSESEITLPSTEKSGFVYDFLGPAKRLAYLRIDHMKHFRESFEARNSLGLESTPQEELEAIPSATEFFRSLVNVMKDAGTEVMIVDLRRNGGGDALMSDIMMYFLYGKARTLETRWSNINRLSQTYLDAREAITLEDLNKGRAVPLVEGDYDFSEDYSDDLLSDTSALGEGFARSPTFYGEWQSESYEGYYCPENVIVLTTPWTFSAGFGIAIRLYRAGAVLVGTPSGQAPNSGANAIKWTLDNTGITGRVSQSYALNFPDDSDPSDVLPVHHPMTYDLLSSYNFDPNAEVLYAMKLSSQMGEEEN
jgi:hypothetical protein